MRTIGASAVKERIFVSSVQKALAAERPALRDYIRSGKLLSQYFEVSCSMTFRPSIATPDQE